MDTKEAGARGGAARAAKLTKRRKRQIAKLAIETRWENYYAAHPERTRPKRKRKVGK